MQGVRKSERINKKIESLRTILEFDDCTKDEIRKKIDIGYYEVGNLILAATNVLPIYEYKIGGVNYYGLLEK